TAYGRNKSPDRQREISAKNHYAPSPPAGCRCRAQCRCVLLVWMEWLEAILSSLGFYPANSNVGIPSTFVSKRNMPPVSGYCFKVASSNPLRAEVRYSSFRFLPPNTHEDTFIAGMGICSS